MQNIIKRAIGFHKGLLLTLMALTLALSASAQTKITGRVVDENGQPAIGANIIVSGTTQGASADIDGKFTLSVKKNATLIVSYLGYKTQEIKVGARTDFQIKLQPDANVMDEVVVVGYGSAKRSDLTGSIASVSAKNIEGYQSGSVLGALSGQVAGVQITTADGTPGSGFEIKIRGIGTVNGDAAPLYIVDGFQVDNIDYLSSSDIEQVDMLKDASAAAIYGARAANGVVLVTTKSGKIGKPTVTYSGSASYRKISKTLDLLNNYEFAKFQQDSIPTGVRVRTPTASLTATRRLRITSRCRVSTGRTRYSAPPGRRITTWLFRAVRRIRVTASPFRTISKTVSSTPAVSTR